MTTYVWRNGELIDKRYAPPPFPRGSRSYAVPLPQLISDKLWDLQGQHDGKVYDSKSALRAAYKRDGFTELGNDAPIDTGLRRPDVKADLADAYRKVREGYKPEVVHEDVLPADCA